MASVTPSAASESIESPPRQSAMPRLLADRPALAAPVWKLPARDPSTAQEADTAVPQRKITSRKSAEIGSRARCNRRPGGPIGSSSPDTAVGDSSGGRQSSAPRPLRPVVAKPVARCVSLLPTAATKRRAQASAAANRRIGSVTGRAYHRRSESAGSGNGLNVCTICRPGRRVAGAIGQAANVARVRRSAFNIAPARWSTTPECSTARRAMAAMSMPLRCAQVPSGRTAEGPAGGQDQHCRMHRRTWPRRALGPGAV